MSILGALQLNSFYKYWGRKVNYKGKLKYVFCWLVKFGWPWDYFELVISLKG